MAETSVQQLPWGEWVLARSQFVGFRSRTALADAVGCTREQLSRWIQMSLPPTQMRRGFDGSLARALRVSGQTLFNDYRTIAPAAALPDEPETSLEVERMRDELHSALDLLDDGHLRALRTLLVGTAA